MYAFILGWTLSQHAVGMSSLPVCMWEDKQNKEKVKTLCIKPKSTSKSPFN